MTSSPNFKLISLVRQAGQDQEAYAGFYRVPPPRRMARGRNSDPLIFYIHLETSRRAAAGVQEQNPLQPAALKQLAQKLAHTFYETPGSVSAAMHKTAAALNEQLLESNLRLAASGQQVVGSLTQVVLQAGGFYLAQSGAQHAFWFSEEGVRHLYDPELSGRSLGMSRSTPIRYFHAPQSGKDALLLAARPAPSWNPVGLGEAYRKGLPALLEMLQERAILEMHALLLMAESAQLGEVPLAAESTGVVTPPVSAASEKLERPAAPRRPVTQAPAAQSSGETPSASQAPKAQAPVVQAPVVQAPVIQAPVVQTPVIQAPVEQAPEVQGSELEPPATAEASPQKRAEPSPASIFWGSVRRGLGAFGRGLGRFFLRLFPEETLQIPTALKALLAIAIPLMIVTASSVVYFQLGRAANGRQLFIQARETAVQSFSQPDTITRRNGLLTALDFLSQSETYGGVPASEVDELRQRIQLEIDQLDQIQRIDYKLVFSEGLDASVQITRMVTAFDDLYLLDSANGQVLRAINTALGYTLDNGFECGVEYGPTYMGQLVDLVVWPDGFQPSATVLAVDSKGSLIFCEPGELPTIHPLVEFPSSGFKKISALAIDRGKLYVLDSGSNSVWVYPQATYDQEPYFYFSEQIPLLRDAIDLAANFDELYLVHSDGRMTMCLADSRLITPTRCNDPQPYTDFRSGRENAPFTIPNPFSQLLANPSPDPSLYFLEPAGQSVFHFSFRSVGFLEELAPLKPMGGGAATGFTVNQLKGLVFIAVGNQVFVGDIP